jgi:hypothetical protein
MKVSDEQLTALAAAKYGLEPLVSMATELVKLRTQEKQAMRNALAAAAGRKLYEVTYRDGKDVCTVHTLAESARDAMDAFVFPVSAEMVGDGSHFDDCGCVSCRTIRYMSND